MRVRIFRIVLTVTFIFVVVSLLSLQVIHGRSLRKLSDKNRIRLLSQEGTRGKILDRNGEVIVTSRLSYNVMVSPYNHKPPEKLLYEISKVLDISVQEIRRRFQKGMVSAFMPVTVAENIDAKKAIALEELKSEYSGLMIQPQPLRDYPYDQLACHLLGYLNEIDRWRLTKLESYGYRTKDMVGFGGVEERYDYYLRQEEGGFSFEVDSVGKFVRVLGFKPPKNGKDLKLTLDLRIQKIVEKFFQDRRGAVIIMDPHTGEIIAMSSRPDFSPRAIAGNNGKYLSSLLTNSASPLINRAISGVYPPGSVFKLVVGTCALENSKINSQTFFYCPGYLQVGSRQFKCWNTHHEQDIVDAVANSCDVFFYRTGLLSGPQLIHDYAVRFGLSKPTGIDLSYEAGGFVPDPLWRKFYKFKNWYDGDTANFAIGQGELMVTPLQMARMTAVFANRGFLVTPYLLQSVGGEDISAIRRKFRKLNLKESTFNYIRRGMRKAVTSPTGTAHILAASGIDIAGKTGTVQVPSGAPHGWFVGFFPYIKPRFVICVFLENVGTGQISCILAKEILEAMKQEEIL